MHSVREIAQSIVADMNKIVRDRNPVAAEHYRRFAVIDYARALKESPFMSPELTERSIQSAYVYAEKAISLGVSEERMEKSFSDLRSYWIPRLEAQCQG